MFLQCYYKYCELYKCKEYQDRKALECIIMNLCMATENKQFLNSMMTNWWFLLVVEWNKIGDRNLLQFTLTFRYSSLIAYRKIIKMCGFFFFLAIAGIDISMIQTPISVNEKIMTRILHLIGKSTITCLLVRYAMWF